MSGFHAEIARESGLQLRDLGSTNGTPRRERISETALQHGADPHGHDAVRVRRPDRLDFEKAMAAADDPAPVGRRAEMDMTRV